MKLSRNRYKSETMAEAGRKNIKTKMEGMKSRTKGICRWESN
jgi:hypothetical protein